MANLFLQLRIGEKIGLGFGLVGLLFLAVIWQTQDTLNRSLHDYRGLIQQESAQKDLLLGLENALMRAQQAETAFVHRPRESLAETLDQQLDDARQRALALVELLPNKQAMSEALRQTLEGYQERFQTVRAAWQRKGLDENSGLQGSFREAVHDLQAMAAHLNADAIYLDLMQIRRSEKDLGLRREAQYQQRVEEGLDSMEKRIRVSLLLDEVKQQLLTELMSYRSSFQEYAEQVLAGGALNGGKGPFRDAAHRIESLINAYYVPDLERDLLQLRRHEKDYLLRGQDTYVQSVLGQSAAIAERIQASAISAEERQRFLSLLQRYQKDFLALVEQNRLIDEQVVEMKAAAEQVVGLVRTELEAANQSASSVVQQINQRVAERGQWVRWLVLLALGLGVFFALKITSSIVKPLGKMTALLEKLTYTELVSPLRHVASGRDEINAMAGYLNTLAQHRNRFISWWRESMDEAEACAQLQRIIERAGEDDSDAAAELRALRPELVKLLETKQRLIGAEVEEMEQLLEKVLNGSAKLLHPSIGRGDVDEQARAIHYAAALLRKSLKMLAFHEQRG